jgi:serine/threonine protein kinase
VTSDTEVNLEPLPGYRLIERIGAGGYGEVWRAEAPGGLTKAIKFVFGQHHERRATNENRALERIRSVRHPFLLSLERIEVVEGRLLVVTELADGSLKDRFDACRREGLHGIPRDELLGYLRDAADALDFMSESHALAHLDIKPENLLLLAGHVKVADFGLVKEVRQTQASLVGGMTPLYAAPEVFRGSPSAHSDQYSLAIVYREMLTGGLPFTGGTVAELTLQHLNDEPDLTPLSLSDRYAVSRALAKDPQHRYRSCREFVDALFRAPSSERSGDSRVGIAHATSTTSFDEQCERPQSLARTNLSTDLFDDDAACWSTTPAELLIDQPPSPMSMVDLAPIEMSNRDTRPTPALVLGIGGAAGRVLSHLRQAFHHQFGAEAALPAVQFLQLDTDPRALSELIRRDGSGLLPDETLNLALRRPQHYREQSQQLLRWLSRRWLYNIPRSLRTEGLRPLGRLALTDHARQTGQRIRRAVSQAVEEEAIRATEQASGQQFRGDSVHVYVVASISGGTGSGMSLDVGYMVRAVLEKLNLKEASITGVMLHATGGDPRHTELARVNAFAWLSELHEFEQPASQYPGDASCGLPAHPAGVPPFDHTYLVHLGENVDAQEFDRAAHCVAEYLRHNLMSPTCAFFDTCRAESLEDSTNQGKSATGCLRSFGIYRRAAASNEECELLANQLSQHVLASWRSIDSAEAAGPAVNQPDDVAEVEAQAALTDQPPAGAPQLVRRMQLDSAGIAANARSVVELQLGGDAENFLLSWFAKQSSTRGAGEVMQMQAIDRIFGVDDRQGSETRRISFLGQPVAGIVQPLDEKLRSEIQRWIVTRVDDTSERIAGARRGATWLTSHFNAAEAELQRLQRTILAKLAEIRQEADAAGGSSAASNEANAQGGLPPRVLDYFRLRLDQLAIAAAGHTVHLILSDIKSMADEVTALGREIDQIAGTVARAANPEPDVQHVAPAHDDPHRAQPRLTTQHQASLAELAAEVDARLQADLISPHGGLLKIVMQGGRTRAMLTSKLQELALQAVQRFLAGPKGMEHSGNGVSQVDTTLRSSLSLATPSFLEHGGTRRVLAILPRDATGSMDLQALTQAAGTKLTAIHGNDAHLTLCVEASQLSLPHIALDLVQRRRDRVEFARRVHCRTDICWSPLIAPPTASTAVTWSNSSDHTLRRTQPRQEMCKTLVM